MKHRPSAYAIAWLALLWFACATTLPLAARPWIALFGSEDCDQCAKIKAEWMELDWTEDEPVLVYISIDHDANYLLLKEVEEHLGFNGKFTSFPIVLYGKKMTDADGFWDLAEQLLPASADLATLFPGLQEAVDAAAMPLITWTAPPAPTATQHLDSPQGTSVVSRAQLLYLSSPGCQKCARQEVELRLLQEQLPGLRVDHYEVSTQDGQIMMRRVVEHFAIKNADTQNLAPLVAWRDGFVTGELATAERLAAELTHLPEPATPFWDAPITEDDRQEMQVRNRNFLEKMTVTTTLLAGLIDGINPCAFATVIFLVSYLLYLKRGRRFVLIAGLLFCAGVFLSYLLFGVGLSFLVTYLNRFAFIRRAFYWAFAIIGLVLAILHLRDALRYRRTGNAADMDMGLNAGTHRKIHDRIHGWATLAGWIALPATVILGVVVSAMEFVCTGQIYLPTILAINSMGFSWKAFASLLLYNVAFILPLIAVTVLAYCGTGAKSLATFARKHVFATKLLMTLLFVLLAIVMIALAFG